MTDERKFLQEVNEPLVVQEETEKLKKKKKKEKEEEQ